MEGKLFLPFIYKNMKQNTQITEALNSVVQGSVFDPILYVIYVNDFSILLAADSLLYAIDITPPRAITMSLATPPMLSPTSSYRITHPHNPKRFDKY